MKRVAFCIVVMACGARSSLDGTPIVADASNDVADASVVISAHPDEVGLAVGPDWICVYRPGGKSRCAGEIGSNGDAAAIQLPKHMWNVRGARGNGEPACGMTPNGLSCWGAKTLLPSGCEEVPTVTPYIHSKTCQPTILADVDFAQVVPPEFVATSGTLFGFAGSGVLATRPQPKPLRAVAYPMSAGVDFVGHVVTWDITCKSNCTSTVIDTGLVAVGITSNVYGVCAWDAAGQLSCWGDATMVGGATPHMMAVPPVRDVVARNVSMCALGQDGSVTCFGCTKTAPCAGYWWGDYKFSPLTTSPQTISFPRPAVALASSYRICAVLDDWSVWCVGAFPDDPDGGLTDTPTHVTALDP